MDDYYETDPDYPSYREEIIKKSISEAIEAGEEFPIEVWLSYPATPAHEIKEGETCPVDEKWGRIVLVNRDGSFTEKEQTA